MPDQSNAKATYGNGSIRERGKSWIGRFYHEGERVEVNLGKLDRVSKTEARKKLRAYMESFQPAPPDQKTTFAELADKFLLHKESMNKSRSTMESYRSAVKVHLNPEFGQRQPSSISAEDVERFQAKILRTRKPKSVHIYMGVLYGILEFGVRKRVLSANVAKEVERPEIPKKLDFPYILDWPDVVRVCDALPDTEYGKTVALMVRVSARTGLRQSELIGLKWSECDYSNERPQLRVVRAWVRGQFKQPKGKRSRAVPMMRPVREALSDQFKRSPWKGDDDLVFPHPETGKPIDRGWTREMFQAACVKAGVGPTKTIKQKLRGEFVQSDLKWHSIRHAFTTWCAGQGIAPRTFMEWIGHEDWKTMLIYNHFSPAGFELDVLDAAAEAEETAVAHA